MGVLGAATAPTVTAGILQVSSWRVVFLAAVPIAMIAFFAGQRILNPGVVVEDPGPLDVVGAAAGTGAIGGLTFVIVQGRVWGWTDSRIVVISLITVISAVVFVRSSRTHSEPLLDFDLLRIPSFTWATASSALLSMSTSATWFLYPLFMTDAWGYSILQVGLAMTPGPAILVVLAPFAGRLADMYGFRRLMILGSLLATLGTAWMAWRLDPNETYVRAFLPGTLGIGTGMALMLGPANAAALSNVPSAQLGAANAGYNTARMTTSALGVAITAAIIGDTAIGDRLDAFALSWWSMVAVMATAPLLLFFGYPADQRRPVDRSLV
jgi:MFS family permease